MAQLRSIRLRIAACLALGALSVVCAVYAFVGFESKVVFWTMMASALLSGINPIVFRMTGSDRLFMALHVSEVVTVSSVLVLQLGGIQGPLIPWLAMLPMLMIFVATRPIALGVTGYCCGLVLVLYGLDQAGVVLPKARGQDDRTLFMIINMALIAFVGAFTCLYHRMRDEDARELDDARARAEKAARVKNEFLANMSHEIRTPMTAVLGYADLLLDLNLSTEERVLYVQTIRRNGDHLMTILNDILDLSKYEAGLLRLESISCCPVQLVEEVASLMRVRAKDKKIHLTTRYDGPIPHRMTADPTRVRQVLMNLIGNAIKFTTIGGVTIRVSASTVGCPPGQLRMSFTVNDTGIGIPQEYIGGIFSAFNQGDNSTTRRFGGTGLGLAMCQRLVGMMGGTLRARSTAGVGSSFRVELLTGWDGVVSSIPMCRADPGMDSGAIARLARSPTGERLRVLLAEDGPDNQVLLSTHLKRLGAAVEIVDNGKLVVDRVLNTSDPSGPIDIILMDMQMPVLDGYSATSVLRSRGYRGPIVALTAHAMSGDRERCMSAGCDDYLSKPIDPAALHAAMERWNGHQASPLLEP